MQNLSPIYQKKANEALDNNICTLFSGIMEHLIV